MSARATLCARRLQRIDTFLERCRDYSVPAVLVLLSGDSGFDQSIRKAQTQRCHVEVLYEHGAPPLPVTAASSQRARAARGRTWLGQLT